MDRPVQVGLSIRPEPSTSPPPRLLGHLAWTSAVRAGVQAPGQALATYGYDNANRLTSIVQGSTNRIRQRGPPHLRDAAERDRGDLSFTTPRPSSRASPTKPQAARRSAR